MEQQSHVPFFSAFGKTENGFTNHSFWPWGDLFHSASKCTENTSKVFWHWPGLQSDSLKKKNTPRWPKEARIVSMSRSVFHVPETKRPSLMWHVMVQTNYTQTPTTKALNNDREWHNMVLNCVWMVFPFTFTMGFHSHAFRSHSSVERNIAFTPFRKRRLPYGWTESRNRMLAVWAFGHRLSSVCCVPLESDCRWSIQWFFNGQEKCGWHKLTLQQNLQKNW